MQRVVFLVDMNAFFISCEMTRNPEIAGRPAAVAGNPKKRTGIILAANYEARKFGVKTTMVIHQALKLCPDMVLVPPDHYFYESKSRAVMNLLGNYSPVIEQNSIDEAWLDMTGTEGLFGSPVEAAERIMTEIKNGLGLWCSIGISENKLLSKIASEIKKPMGITELWVRDVPAKLWPLSVTALYGVGRQTGIRLNNIGIQTVGDLAGFNARTLCKALGKQGTELQRLANGIDNSPVTPHTAGEMKSIGRSNTLAEDITEVEEVRAVFLEMCEEIGFDARRYNKKAKTIQITVKYSDFQSINRQISIEPTCLTRDIYEKGFALLKKNWNNVKPVRLIGISISGFEQECSCRQLSLFEQEDIYDDNYNASQKEEKIEKAIDGIRLRLGTKAVTRAAQIKKPE
ncbi:DNA polymerase-4 [Ruminiclostridium sufflavum DSM 19573]|uniref:DNA polymerase IV n=1 Tax=Ruminiclostridium sufflavum DSM 19573 TaxID=1121337 RepID=A0A318XIE2_9FIRM|nr:DNA polymerase IV [Ruminiclostridium sufflavum]PYG86955.1 DNA polymerase-4 [Ruminiclostridium sufflavum DSM 19573]